MDLSRIKKLQRKKISSKPSMPLFTSVFNHNNKDDNSEDDIGSSLMKTKITPQEGQTTPRKGQSPATPRTPRDNGKFDMDSNIVSLGRIFNIELCHTEHDNQKFERDLMRMLKVISMVVVKKKELILSSSLIGYDSSVDLLSLHTQPNEFEEIQWKSTDKISIQLFIEFINGIGKLFNGSSDVVEKLPESFTEEQYFEMVGHKPAELDENDMKNAINKLYADKHPEVIRYLSGIAQLVVVSTLGKLASGIIATKAPLQPKDVRGSWTVQFRRYEQDADDDDCTFGILHERTDCIMKKESAAIMRPMYNFKWQVEIKFKTREILDVQAVHVRLVDIEWICDPLLKVPESEKEEFISTCKKFFSVEKASLTNHNFDKCPLIPSGKTLIECVCHDVLLALASYTPPTPSTPSGSVGTSSLKPKKNKHEMSWLKKLLLTSTSDSNEIFEALSKKSSSNLGEMKH